MLLSALISEIVLGIECVEVIARVQGGVTQVLERVAMPLVCAALADESGLAAHGQAVLGVGQDGYNFAFS